MAKFNKWDVVLINFPFTDGSNTKLRPAVVWGIVLNEIGEEDVVLCAVSSQSGLKGGIDIPESHPEFSKTGLDKASKILPGKIFTLAKSKIRGSIGAIGPTLQQQLGRRLQEIIIK